MECRRFHEDVPRTRVFGGHSSLVSVDMADEEEAPLDEASFNFILFIALCKAETVSSHAGRSQSSCFFRKASRGDGLTLLGILENKCGFGFSTTFKFK